MIAGPQADIQIVLAMPLGSNPTRPLLISALAWFKLIELVRWRLQLTMRGGNSVTL
ncbi:hypothetical protein [Methylobacterium longum]|uniref:Uncharacterized protein n=1 Tax=Methylobacterium longum TaxID=767694 RepID=A0ABT8AQA9_9HYPH|nr:hypothetical protein [Methylobacterium longum]MDN3571780.1 hypothetical protein [Methylobacterium longum]